MALVWSDKDVAAILVALASAAKGRDPSYHQALRDVALAMGMPPDKETWELLWQDELQLLPSPV